MGLRLSAYTQCPMLHNKTLSIKPVDYLASSAKTALKTYKLPFEQISGSLCHLDRAHSSPLWCPYFPPPFNETLLLLYNLCLCPGSCETTTSNSHLQKKLTFVDFFFPLLKFI
jgi:hypothetical protein